MPFHIYRIIIIKCTVLSTKRWFKNYQEITGIIEFSIHKLGRYFDGFLKLSEYFVK